MHKELIWASVIGILFGLVIAFGAWRINSSINKSPKNIVQETPIPENQTSEFKITLNKPSENDVVTLSPITVEGITKPLTWIVVSGEKGDYILQSDEKGIFTQETELDPGVNQIKITAFDPKGLASVQKVLVVFSSAFQTNPLVPTREGTSTESSDITKKVAEKVAAALNQPKAYIGVVTDIADSTVQIKTPESQIKQVSISGESINVVNSKGTNNKQVKLTDIAIGDFIVAMGYINGNQVLKAQRILITDPTMDNGISASFGRVTGVSKKNMTLEDVKTAQSYEITPVSSTSIKTFVSGKIKASTFAATKENDLVISVMDSSGTNPQSRTIFNLGQS